jgi:hypothetical protein
MNSDRSVAVAVSQFVAVSVLSLAVAVVLPGAGAFETARVFLEGAAIVGGVMAALFLVYALSNPHPSLHAQTDRRWLDRRWRRVAWLLLTALAGRWRSESPGKKAND